MDNFINQRPKRQPILSQIQLHTLNHLLIHFLHNPLNLKLIPIYDQFFYFW